MAGDMRQGLAISAFCTTTSNVTIIKTHGSESRGQEEAAYTHVFWPTQPLQ